MLGYQSVWIKLEVNQIYHLGVYTRRMSDILFMVAVFGCLYFKGSTFITSKSDISFMVAVFRCLYWGVCILQVSQIYHLWQLCLVVYIGESTYTTSTSDISFMLSVFGGLYWGSTYTTVCVRYIIDGSCVWLSVLEGVHILQVSQTYHLGWLCLVVCIGGVHISPVSQICHL